jgi:hypothetical protein
VVVAVTVSPETVALAVFVDVQDGETHDRVVEFERVAVQVSACVPPGGKLMGLGRMAMDTTVGVPELTVNASEGAVRLSAVQLMFPVPGVAVAVTVKPETVAKVVFVDVQAGEMQERVVAFDRVVVQART